MYLLDTNILSVRGTRPDILAWMHEHKPQLFMASMSIAEIADGLAKLRRQGASRKADDLSVWFERLVKFYARRILPFDVEAARIAGALSDQARGNGHAADWPDIIIAAIAKQKGFTVMTRNIRHFLPMGSQVIDPYVELPSS